MKYKKLIFLLGFAFGILFFIPTLSHASAVSPCTGPIYSDATASQACATLAETQGKALGYTITCASQKVGLLYPELNTGLMYYYNATCTVNGYTGQSGELLAGYTGYTGLVNGRSLSWSGNTQGWDTFATNTGSGTSTNGTGTTGGANDSCTLTATCATNTLSSAEQTINAIKTQVNQEQIKYINQISQVVNSTCGSGADCQALNNLETQLYQTGASYTPPPTWTSAPVSNPPATTPPPLACSLTATCNLNSPVVVASGTLSPFRYLKVETTENGWVSWREIEIYNENGQKITPVSATASDTYDQNSLPWSTNTPAYPRYVYDGNYETAWNSGETNPTCKGNWTSACPPSLRSAWIKVDLGSVKNVSKIRLMKNGENSSHSTKISISTDNNNYTNIATFNAPALDRQWLEFPSQYITPPEINLTVNGSSSTNVTPGHGVYYKWDIKNADSVTVSYTKKLVKAPTIPLAPYAAAVYCVYQKDGILPSIPVPFSSQKLVPLSGDTVYYFQPHDTFTDCSKGYQFDVTFKAIQSVSGKSTTKTVSILVGEDKPAPLSFISDISSGYLAPANSTEAYQNNPQTILHSGESGSAPVVGYQSGCKDPSNPVRDTSVPPIILGTIPSGVTITLNPVILDPWDPSRDVCEQTFFRTKLNVSVGSAAQPGFTFLKVYINGKYGEYGLNIK